MPRLSTCLSLAISMVLIVSCGNEILDTQEGLRKDIKPVFVGSWVSTCDGSEVTRLRFSEAELTFERNTFYDPECLDPKITVTQTGTYELANTYKTGQFDSIIFMAGDSFQVTYFSDYDLESQNNVLIQVRNEKEVEIKSDMTSAQKRKIKRSNLRIRMTKPLADWVKGKPTALNRLQYEKLSSGLGAKPIVDFNSRLAFRYQMDNDYLQVSQLGVNSRTFDRE